MKQISTRLKAFSTLFMLLFFNVITFAQTTSPKVEVNGEDVGSWFSRNWIWVVAGVVVLLLIIIFSSKSSSSSSRSTVVKRDDGFGTRTTTSTTTVND